MYSQERYYDMSSYMYFILMTLIFDQVGTEANITGFYKLIPPLKNYYKLIFFIPILLIYVALTIIN